WGHMEVLHKGPGFLVKSLVLKPGAATSLQMHRHRAEHMTIARGLARIACNDQVHELRVGQSIDIPCGAKHRLENPGTKAVQVIEVWLGAHPAEPALVRFEDRYGRA